MYTRIIVSFLLILLVSIVTVSSSFSQELTIADVSDCSVLIQTGKTEAERTSLRENYHTLLGILSDLGNYRKKFLEDGDLIDLFPTAYYHTTLSELKRVSAADFNYPIEKMQQMIAFYDAYKRNRSLWDKGQKMSVEKHWVIHFEYVEDHVSDLAIVCPRQGFALASAIIAHVKYDLPRAIRYAYQTRFTREIKATDPKYLMDFSTTNDLFKITKSKTIADIITSKKFCSEWVMIKLLSTADGTLSSIPGNLMAEHEQMCKRLGVVNILTDEDVIMLRQEAWRLSYSSSPIKGVDQLPLASQPVLNHEQLKTVGLTFCHHESNSSKNISSFVRIKEFLMPGNPSGPIDTRILISKDEYVYIECLGKITVGYFVGAVSGNGTSNPFLNPYNKYPFNHGALIYKLGSDSNACTTLFNTEISDIKAAYYASSASQSKYFSRDEGAVVGCYFIAKESGYLKLDINDEKITDNKGFFKVRIFTIKKETFSSKDMLNKCPPNSKQMNTTEWTLAKNHFNDDSAGDLNVYEGVSSKTVGCQCSYEKNTFLLNKKQSRLNLGAWLAREIPGIDENEEYLKVILDMLPNDLYNK